MSTRPFDIHQHILPDWESLNFPDSHARALRLFQESVTRPSLLTVNTKIAENMRSDNLGDIFFREVLEILLSDTIKSYVLAVQAMWERAIRGLLVKRETRICGDVVSEIKKIEKALWSDEKGSLQWHFERLIGIPLAAFDSFEDLEVLQNLASAIRHGDGRSARRLFELAPSLWGTSSEVPPTVLFGQSSTNSETSAKHPSFDGIKLHEDLLEQMIFSICGFWEDIECIRCNSFRWKSSSVERKLLAWPEERRMRQYSRIWKAG